ncbi:pyridine nucleotide-disulfide oxidoreductase [Modestobacter sp. I12A-02628]|uniref:NAD(P)/FAD-dependent oxidoreductase n=1 Tax=Goekera deserti TaxID=2497753 RepID=A0A7K3WBV3_9ACTN|nr:NAD(P)/FAD-dependent oxidoreductase [Goekera deserti]MPQ98222.1 pyridine nucleotide-disulfide oxidoreductase [Goekera deserti]NDI48048.1 FAD-dependent oxidoreductase [Goekera deserti]NEL53796.1 NAD(P)/FAD-dependent oxidoreductase [Goekera deserti]
MTTREQSDGSEQHTDPATWDVVVLGAGPTGENLADVVVRGGLSAVVVEAELVGGECSYWACMPSKALLRGPEALAAAQAVGGVTGGALDVAATLARRDGFAAHWDDAGQARWLSSAGIDLVRGHGRLTGERTVVVTAEDGSERTLTARHAVAVCTGSTAMVPPVEGLAEVGPWTSREGTSSPEVPGRLVVIGGGVVACELATAWSALGSRVTVLQRGAGLLTGLEPAAGAAVAAGLRGRGVDVRTGVQVRSVRREEGDVVVATGGSDVRADQVLVATGRAAATTHLGLESVGLEPGAFLDVDDSLRVTGVPGSWLYAVGDVNHRALLTHMGKYQARQAGAAIVARARGTGVDLADWSPHVATADTVAVPSVVFSDPQVASVGRTAQQAADAGLPHRVVEYALGNVAGSALYADGYTGTAIAVVDTERQVLLGMTLVGPGVGELLHAATVAVVGEVPIARLWHAVPAFPTMSEIWLRLLETLRDSDSDSGGAQS